MQATHPVDTPALERHLEAQMGAQERQLALVRAVLAALAGVAFVLLADRLMGVPILIGTAAAVAAYSAVVPWLLRRFPAREVGIVSTALEMAAVTVAVYVAGDELDLHLFYGLVILGTALRFGLWASVWAAIVMSGLYVAVATVAPALGEAVREELPVRAAYLIGFGVVSGLFSRILIGRAAENAQLQERLAEEERARERALEQETIGRLGRDFVASLERESTLRAIVTGAAPLLGVVTMVHLVSEGERRLEPAAAAGTEPDVAERWRAEVASRRPTIGQGAVGTAAATATTREGRRDEVESGDPDGLQAIGLDWVLAVPIMAGGRLLGVLATAGRGPGRPPEPVRHMAEAVAERAGPALQNALLWTDLQQRMALERDAQRIKDDFLSIVSHELRTPLTSIQGYSQLLEGRLRADRSEESKELAHLRVIRSQVARMRRLVDDLLDVSRLDRRGGVSIEPVDFDLAELVREAVSRVARQHSDRDIAVAAPESLRVRADRDRIDQVLSNLVENAVKYSPEGGPIRVAADRSGTEVEVRVSDSGVGIPAQHRDHVFERFYQADDDSGRRRFGGLGLGLYISRAIVEAHGGRIRVGQNADGGRGSTFVFRIPREAFASATEQAAPTGEPPAFVLRRHEKP